MIVRRCRRGGGVRGPLLLEREGDVGEWSGGGVRRGGERGDFGEVGDSEAFCNGVGGEGRCQTRRSILLCEESMGLLVVEQ